MRFKLVESYKEDFRERTQKHINLVCKYGEKIGQDYADHDSDKLNELFDDYALMFRKDHFGGAAVSDNLNGLSDDEKDRLNRATFIHITTQNHHPESWCEEPLENFDREHPQYGLHCESMPNWAIDEMLCDWAACSEEFGTNTPQEWMDKTVPSRWVFTNEQQRYMKGRLDEIWGE